MNSNLRNLRLLKMFLTTLFGLLLCVNLKVTAQKNTTALEDKLSRAIDSLFTANNVPGIAVGIWTPEFTYKKVVGNADLKKHVERKIDDKIRIGSITKTFVGTVILQLADEGKLNIDDKLDKYYPLYPNASNITIRQMLDMTSGIPDYLNDPLIDQSFLYYRTNKFTPPEIYEATIGLTPTFAPGAGWNYSNGNYNILGMMIEKLTGNKIEDEINKRIIQPLNLTNTSFPVIAEMEGQYSNGYSKDTLTGGFIDVTVMDPSITWAAGAMVSNIDDLRTYALALAKGDLLSKKMQEERLKFVKTGVADFLKYGLAIFSVGGFIGHNGGITGYNTFMGYHPEYDALFILSVNEFGKNGGVVDNVFMDLAKIVYPDKKLFD